VKNIFSTSIGAKFGAGFALVLILSLGTTVFAVSRMKLIYSGTAEISSHWLNGVKLSSDIRHFMHSTRRAQLRLEPQSTMDYVALKERDVNNFAHEMKKLLEAYDRIVTTDEERALLKAVKGGVDSVIAGNASLFVYMKKSEIRDREEIFKVNNVIQKIMADAEDTVAKLIEFNEKGSKLAEESAADVYHASLMLTYVTCGVVLLVSFLLSIVITRNIRNPLAEIVEAVGNIERGDLSVRISKNRQDELGKLQASLANMLVALHSVIDQVDRGAKNLNGVSEEIASANQELAGRTEESANSIRVTTSAVSQLARSVAQSSDAANSVNQLASTAANVAKRGGTAVSEVVANMDEITSSSKKIAAIVDVINGIAFQTNILALNAAVEAARAGEHGRGFAVVASEVRSLAHRSAEAAKEIKELISASVTSVESGVRLVHTAGATMGDIVASVQSVSTIIADLTASSSTQSRDINEISSAIEQLEHMTEQNAALVEESYATAETLKGQANNLVSSIGHFRLG
jgi:methyl-accepting chemotaxis protein